jgi:hypothetical protein
VRGRKGPPFRLDYRDSGSESAPIPRTASAATEWASRRVPYPGNGRWARGFGAIRMFPIQLRHRDEETME